MRVCPLRVRGWGVEGGIVCVFTHGSRGKIEQGKACVFTQGGRGGVGGGMRAC